MRQKGASTLIYLIFGGLIVIFVITPLSGPGDIGCSTSSSVVVDVDGNRVNENSYKIAYSNPFNGFPGRQKVYYALDTAIRRELLASAAEDHGIRVTDDMVTQEITKGFFFVGGERQDLEQMIFDIDADGDRTWNLNKFRGLVQSLDVSKNAYLDEQKRGLQATLMAELLASSAQVSRDEALSEYLFDNTTVSYDVVTFSPALYRAAMLLTEADAERFLAAHEDQVKARHQEKEREYLGRKPELKLRQIFIAKAAPAAGTEDKKPDEQKAAGATKADEKKAEKDAGDADATRPAGMPIEEAKAKLEAARDAVISGKQKFPELARQLNTEPALKASGGYVGWKTAESASLGEKVVSDAVKDLKPGEMTPVIATDRGAYLVIAEDQREKDLTYDQVKLEIAAELAREVWSKEAAKRDALRALETARASGKKLDELYPREVKPGLDLQELQRQMNDPNIDPQIRQILQQQFQQQIQLQLGGGDDHGSILTIESPDVPAASKPGDGDSAGAPAGGSAAPAGDSAAP
ncbi:MAG TPA: SurA N-terminal domain-containing protein, partial [Kofleriaceae bacterium]|nr:SurA N-terminal domain-containing protein [Kofleriaceae bacterium]